MSEWVFYIGEFIFNMIKVLMAFRLVEAASTPRRGKAVEKGAVWATGIVVAGITTYNIFVCKQVFSNNMMAVCAIALSVVVLFLRRIKWLDAFSIIYLFWVMIHILDFFIQTLVCIVLGKVGLPKFVLLEANVMRGIYLICCTVGVILFKYWLLREKEVFRHLKKMRLIEVISLSGMTFVMIYFQQIYIQKIYDDYMASWMLFWLGGIVVMGIAALYVQKNRVIEANRIMQMKMQLLEVNYEQATERYKEKAELLHDEKHHLGAIRELLDSGKAEDAIKYVNEVSKKISQSGSRVWSKHSFLDLVLNMKLQEAEEKLIDVEICFDDMEGIVMQETDISVLFGNILDNAIEATEKIFDPDERWIKIFGERKGKLFVLNISNPVGQAVQFRGEELVTSKSDKKLHGYGMQSIRRIVEKYHGEVEVTEENGIFFLTVILNGFDECCLRAKSIRFKDN